MGKEGPHPCSNGGPWGPQDDILHPRRGCFQPGAAFPTYLALQVDLHRVAVYNFSVHLERIIRVFVGVEVQEGVG